MTPRQDELNHFRSRMKTLLSTTLKTNTKSWFLHGSKSSEMAQPPFKIFLVAAWLGVLTWSGTSLFLVKANLAQRKHGR